MNTIEQSPTTQPPMREFNVSNDLLGDRHALNEAFERDGYWFFRNVLDQDAISKLRHAFLDALNDLGLVDSARTDDAIYNGAPLDNYPINNQSMQKQDPLLIRNHRNDFVIDPAIKAFFEQVFGGDVFWVPNTEYHAAPPKKDRSGSRFNFVHCDGANNIGLPLKICWIPLVTIDEETGGLALAEGLHKPRIGDFPRAAAGIKFDDVPASAWRRTTYQPGDVLVFGLDTPHSGLANYSKDRFRLSMDIRGMLQSENIPAVGTVSEIDACAIAINTDDGDQKVFRLDENTFCRITRGKLTGMPLALEEIPQLVKIGDPVYIASERGRATFIRPQH